MPKKNLHQKVTKLVSEGDSFAAKEKYDKAYAKYHEAHELEPDYEGLFDKLLSAHEKSIKEENWEMKDFAEHIEIIMHKQEHDNPAIKQVHAKLTPEWKQANSLILKILETDDDNSAGPFIEELVEKGETATRALIDILRSIKKGAPEEKEEDIGE